MNRRYMKAISKAHRKPMIPEGSPEMLEKW